MIRIAPLWHFTCSLLTSFNFECAPLLRWVTCYNVTYPYLLHAIHCYSGVLKVTKYLIFILQKPRIHCKEGEFKHFIRENVPIINQKYWPTLWCFEARFQSVLASLIRSFVVPPAPYIRYIHYIIHAYILM